MDKKKSMSLRFLKELEVLSRDVMLLDLGSDLISEELREDYYTQGRGGDGHTQDVEIRVEKLPVTRPQKPLNTSQAVGFYPECNGVERINSP